MVNIDMHQVSPDKSLYLRGSSLALTLSLAGFLLATSIPISRRSGTDLLSCSIMLSLSADAGITGNLALGGKFVRLWQRILRRGGDAFLGSMSTRPEREFEGMSGLSWKQVQYPIKMEDHEVVDEAERFEDKILRSCMSAASSTFEVPAFQGYETYKSC